MTLAVWRAEWLTAVRRRRLFLFNILIPLTFVATIALSSAPAVHAAAVFTVLFTVFGTFGSSIPLIRDGESGLLRRYVLTGIHPGGLLLQRVFATAALDLIELAPSVLVIVAARGSSASQFAMVVGALILGLLAANALGALTAALARSVAEGALLSAMAALLLLHWAGRFVLPFLEHGQPLWRRGIRSALSMRVYSRPQVPAGPTSIRRCSHLPSEPRSRCCS